MLYADDCFNGETKKGAAVRCEETEKQEQSSESEYQEDQRGDVCTWETVAEDLVLW